MSLRQEELKMNKKGIRIFTSRLLHLITQGSHIGGPEHLRFMLLPLCMIISTYLLMAFLRFCQ
jgi:hypothetical protein